MLSEALERFEELVRRAQSTPLREPLAVTLATATPAGRPAARIVLLRGFDSQGFVFYTNTSSRKGRELAANPQAALCVYWDALAEQVRIEGQVAVVTDAEADAYWQGRPRESQIGAWASLQSETLDDRSTLTARVAQFEDQFAGRPVPRPAHWTGYRLVPDRIEFWSSRPARLHERWVYERAGSEWRKRQMYP